MDALVGFLVPCLFGVMIGLTIAHLIHHTLSVMRIHRVMDKVDDMELDD